MFWLLVLVDCFVVGVSVRGALCRVGGVRPGVWP